MTIFSHELQNKQVWIEFPLTFYPCPSPHQRKQETFQNSQKLGNVLNTNNKYYKSFDTVTCQLHSEEHRCMDG